MDRHSQLDLTQIELVKKSGTYETAVLLEVGTLLKVRHDVLH